MKILVIDNHPVMLKFMSNLLEKQGHQVSTAKDGLSALEILESFIPDVAFIDLVMPNIDGRKLCRLIRGMQNMKDVCLVLVSGIAADVKMDLSFFGADTCIAKGPVDKMGEHVLSVLDILKKGSAADLPKKIIGLGDIHARITTKELLSAKKHSEKIFNNMEEGIIELNSEGKIFYANPAGISIIGIPEKDLLGSNFIELLSDIQAAMVKRLFETSGESPSATPEESPLSLNNNLVSLDILQINEENDRSIVVFLHDITERKRAEKKKLEVEKKLQKSQKMSSIATLAGGIAHQFNNALAAVIGNTELLQMDRPGDEVIENYVESIKNPTERMIDLTAQLLAYARRGKYQMRQLSVNDLVRDTLILLTHTFDLSIKVNTDLPDDIMNIEADFTQLQMVLSSVLSNASEAIGSDGQIQISVENVNIDDRFIASHPEFEKGRYARLTVEDDGHGMDEKTLKRIFEPFYTTKFLGRGLGMAAVHGIVRNHGGTILIESELNEGTKVCIYLPLVEAEIKEAKGPEKELFIGSGTVLLIEDEEIVMDVNQMLLERLGYRVLTAKTGEEAIHIVNTADGDIDLAILDIVLPDMGGEAVYPLLKKVRPDLKVLVCSGCSIDGPAQEILDAGAQGFLQKPFRIEKLSENLDEVLTR